MEVLIFNSVAFSPKILQNLSVLKDKTGIAWPEA